MGLPVNRAAAEAFDEFAQRDAERFLDKAALTNVAGELEGQRAARAAHAVILVGRTTAGKDEGHSREAQHVVDDGGLAEQAFECGDRRLEAHHAALAFEAFEHRGLFAADIGARTAADLEVEGFVRALNIPAQPVGCDGCGDRLLHGGDGVRIFRADIDVALGGADGDAGNGHALDEHEGVALHHHAVCECAGVALVGIAADVFLVRRGVEHRLPLDAGGEARTAAAAEAELGDFGHDGGACEAQRLAQAFEAAMRHIIRNRDRVGDAAAGEGKAFLILQIGVVLDIAEVQGVAGARAARMEGTSSAVTGP